MQAPFGLSAAGQKVWGIRQAQVHACDGGQDIQRIALNQRVVFSFNPHGLIFCQFSVMKL